MELFTLVQRIEPAITQQDGRQELSLVTVIDMSTLLVSNLIFQSNSFLTEGLVKGNKLWCAFNASTGTPVIANSYSTSSIIDISVGRYRVLVDLQTLSNSNTHIACSSCIARDNNASLANVAYPGAVGIGSGVTLAAYTTAYVDPLYVGVMGSYNRYLR